MENRRKHSVVNNPIHLTSNYETYRCKVMNGVVMSDISRNNKMSSDRGRAKITL